MNLFLPVYTDGCISSLFSLRQACFDLIQPRVESMYSYLYTHTYTMTASGTSRAPMLTRASYPPARPHLSLNVSMSVCVCVCALCIPCKCVTRKTCGAPTFLSPHAHESKPHNPPPSLTPPNPSASDPHTQQPIPASHQLGSVDGVGVTGGSERGGSRGPAQTSLL